ncbi:MAG TPA: serine/threonine-protein kinase, partial [Nannocystis sp.]
MIPDVLDGRYQLLEVLGLGGQGKVFRGRDLHTGANVAVKVMDDARASPEAVARFAQEGRLAARIRDPHLVAAMHFGVWQGYRYIVFDNLAGVAPVTTLLDRGRMDPYVVCDLARQLLGALDALHQAGVAHLDLAPANCLWRERSSGRIEVFLADLGSAAAAVPVTGGPRRSSEPVGTVHFMAPEMLEEAPVDQRADLWSLGALMYVLLTGIFVDLGDEDEPLAVPPPAVLVPSIPAAISDIVMGALTTVERRFASAVAMMASIDAGLAGRPALLVASSRSPARVPIWAGVGGVALAAVLAVLGTYRILDAQSCESPSSPRPEIECVPATIEEPTSVNARDTVSSSVTLADSEPPATRPPDGLTAGSSVPAAAVEAEPARTRPLQWSTVKRVVQRQAPKLRKCSSDDAVTLGVRVKGGRVTLESFDGRPAAPLPHHECAR